MGFHDRDLYPKPLEIHNSLYQLIGWRALDKVQGFEYLEFIRHVQELDKSKQTDVKIQSLIDYVKSCQFRLLVIPPKDSKNLVCVNSFLTYISRLILTNRIEIRF
jgi:hypothetical protein